MSNRRRLRAPDRHNSRATTIPLRESATGTIERSDVQTLALSEANTSSLRSANGVRRYRARLIKGDVQGARGFYPSSMLRESAGVFRAGLPIYADHPTETEEFERPERSIRDLAGRLVTDAIYESDGLYADIEVYPMFAPLVEAIADSIGLSIRARGTVEHGKPSGQRGPLVTSITHAESVDFVTAAGAGGGLVSLIESARPVRLAEARNVEAWFESRIHSDFTQLADDMYGHGKLTREERITLSSAVGDALAAFTAKLQADAPQLATRDIYEDPTAAGDTSAATTESLRRDVAQAAELGVPVSRLREATSNEVQCALDAALVAAYGDDSDVTQWIYVLDYDPDASTVWYAVSDNQSRTTWQQQYELSTTDAAATSAALADDRIQVVARTTYVPVPADEQAPDDTDGDNDTDTDVTESAAVEAPTTTTDVADGAPPTVSTQPVEEGTGMTGPQNTGPAPGAAGTAEDTTVSTAVAEAQAGRVAAEAKLAESDRRATDAETRLARFTAVEAARPIASTLLAESQLPAAAQARVLAQVTANVPLTEANVLDEAAFRTAVTDAATAEETYLASLREAAGEGRVTGFGGSTTSATVDEATRLANRAARFQSTGMSEAAAMVAAKGGRI